MAILDDTGIASSERFAVLRPVGRRVITHCFHDVDGTHSLIRDWPPVMSAVLEYAMNCGLADDFDSPANGAALVARVSESGDSMPVVPSETGVDRTMLAPDSLHETDRFCIESAGLSALTQMEWGIRRAIERGAVPPEVGLNLSPQEAAANAEIVRRIWAGEERFETVADAPAVRAFIAERAPRLFRLYERVLAAASRDRNLADARRHPERWRVPGSLAFIHRLHGLGCTNYFITGAVLYPDGGMAEEVAVLGFEVGPGRMVEAIEGSAWDRKMPKGEVMRRLCARDGIDPARVLVVGDGRSEIGAGVQMGCVTMSRLPLDAARQRALHTSLGANYIVTDFDLPALLTLIQPGD